MLRIPPLRSIPHRAPTHALPLSFLQRPTRPDGPQSPRAPSLSAAELRHDPHHKAAHCGPAAWAGELDTGYVHQRARETQRKGPNSEGTGTLGQPQRRATPPTARSRPVAARPARPAPPPREPRPHPPSPAQGSPAPRAQAPAQARVSPPRLRSGREVPGRRREAREGPNGQHGGGRQLTMIMEGMLTGKEVTEKADGIVPGKAAPTTAVRPAPPIPAAVPPPSPSA